MVAHRKDKHEGRREARAALSKSQPVSAAAVSCPYCKKKFKQWQYLNVHKKRCAAAKLQHQVSSFHSKFQRVQGGSAFVDIIRVGSSGSQFNGIKLV